MRKIFNATDMTVTEKDDDMDEIGARSKDTVDSYLVVDPIDIILDQFEKMKIDRSATLTKEMDDEVRKHSDKKKKKLKEKRLRDNGSSNSV